VIEMNNRQDNPKLTLQLQQRPQERHRINPAGNGHANAVPGPQHFLPSNVAKHTLRQWMHGIMVPHSSCADSRPRLSAERSSAFVASTHLEY